MTDTPRQDQQQSTPAAGGRTVTAMFRSRSDAEFAVDRLIDDGFARNAVRLVPGSERDLPADSATGSERREGFWASLADFFFPETDRGVYAEGLSRGEFLVSVATTAANHDRAVDILDDEGTIDLDEAESTWRSQGWSGSGGSGSTATAAGGPTDVSDAALGDTTGYGSVPAAANRMAGDSLHPTPGANASFGPGGDPSASSGRTFGRHDPSTVAPQEDLPRQGAAADKREPGGNRIRVRSYGVETPAAGQTTLRREPLTLRDTRLRDEAGSGRDAGSQPRPFADGSRNTDVEVDDQRRADERTRKPL